MCNIIVMCNTPETLYNLVSNGNAVMMRYNITILHTKEIIIVWAANTIQRNLLMGENIGFIRIFDRENVDGWHLDKVC